MNDEQLEALGEWMARVERLLQRIEGNTSCIDGALGDLTIRVGELFQAVDGIQADLMQKLTGQEP